MYILLDMIHAECPSLAPGIVPSASTLLQLWLPTTNHQCHHHYRHSIILYGYKKGRLVYLLTAKPLKLLASVFLLAYRVNNKY